MKNQTSPLRIRILFLVTLFCAAMASVQIVHAATITVMNTNDSGASSLRQTLADANDGDTINFDSAVTGTITLTSGELLVNKSVMISGPGANVVAVNGNAASRGFHIASGKTVSISGLTITNGFAGFGGGILNDHATLTVSNCTLSANSTGIGFGGGIYNASAVLTVNNSTLSGNLAGSQGGGIYNDHAMLTINNSTLSGNSTSVDPNLLPGECGGIYNNAGTLSVNNSTLSDNFGSGGGITNDSFNGSATLTIGNTILKAGSLGQNIDSGATVTSLGYNLSSDNGGGYLTATGDQINIDPMLGPLQDNGGPTFTHQPLIESPATDAGDPALGMDQRGTGYPRVANNRIDIGAVEVQSTPIPTPTPTPTPTATPEHTPPPHPTPRPH